MGKITGDSIEDVKVKVPRNQNGTVCGAEVVGFLACLDTNNGNEAMCASTKKSLFDCMELAMSSGAFQRRHKMPTNYHIRTVRAGRAIPFFFAHARTACPFGGAQT
jgi:hypothetical protein